MVRKKWFGLSALKLGLNAATHIYKKRQETKMAMADAQHMHAAKMAKGEEAYQGKLLEARQSDWKDEFVLLVLSAPIVVLAWAVISEDPTAMDKVNYSLSIFLHSRHGLLICGFLSWLAFMVLRVHRSSVTGKSNV